MRRELLLFVLAVLLYGLVNFTSAEVITISSTEIWDGRAQHGITPYGSGTSLDPYVYDIPEGMAFTSSGVIKMNDKHVVFDFSYGTAGLEMAAGSYFDLTGSTRLSDPGKCWIILETHSLTGAGDFKTVDISKDSMDVIIGGVNDVSVNSFYMRTDNAFAGTVYIHVAGSVNIGSIDTQDQAAGGNNGGDVTIYGGDITIGDIDTRSLCTASSDRTSGSVLLEARDYWGANMLSTDVNLSGTVNTDSPVGTDGDVSMSAVVVTLGSGSNIARGSGSLDISAGVEQYGRTADDLFIDNSGGGYSATHDVPWSLFGTEVSFETAESGDAETVSPARLAVVLYNPPGGQTVTVEYAVSGGTADGNGVDYTLDSGVLSFGSGVTSRAIEATVVDDAIGEEDETVEVGLFNPVNADLGANVEHTYTIIDFRAFVEFDAKSSHSRENASPAEIPVSLSWASADMVTVDYTVTGGTATRDADYVLADGTLTFDPCQTTQSIAVDIIDDDSEEGYETIVLTLSNPTGNSRLGDNTQHAFTISEQIPLLKGAFYFRADSDPSARVGPHPDVMVRLGLAEDKLIFRRDKGYSPVWYGEDCSEQDLPTEVARSNCENNVNPFSRASIIETNPARAIVHWRYARDCDNVSPTGWVDEYFTVYPDGACIRTVKNAAGTTFAQWNSLAPDIERMRLLAEGIEALPAEWLNPAALSVTSSDYTYEGFNEERRCYELKCNVTSAPSALDLTLDTSGGKSIHHPAIVLKNWGDADADVTVTGSGSASRHIGYVDDMYGDHLVVWLGVETTSSIDISITPRGGSGQFVDRAPPADFGYDFDINVPPLPMGSPEPGPFGAYYTNMKFNNRFDEYWRVGDHTDVVVQFDDNAHRFVFWRGTNYGPHWVSDTNETSYSNWYGTQFVERRAREWGEDGCCAEPMQDWDCRYAHARIISSNPARAIVQWRYASCDPDYDIVRDGSGDVWGDWDEEYFTIYPDAISVRKVTAYSSRTGGSDMESPHIEYHEAIPVTNPGTIPEDNIHWNALSATDYSGGKEDWVAEDEDGGAMTDLHLIANRPIMVVRMKGSTVPVSIVEGTAVEHDPVGQDECRPFNAYDDWPAWPEGDRSGGAGSWYWREDPDTHCYRNFWTKYPSHCSILHLKWDDYEHLVDQKRTKIMLFGMYDAAEAANVNNLIPLARSWQYAPTLTITSAGFSGGSYDKAERAYKISRDSQDATELEFTVNASSNSPVHNACFVIENWRAPVRLHVDGQVVEPGPDFRQGTEKTADEVPSLVVWITGQSTSPINVAISEPAVGDLDADGDIDGMDLGRFLCDWLVLNFGQATQGDLNGDKQVNSVDFAILASRWLDEY